MAHSIKKQMTFEGRSYVLTDKARVRAELSHQTAGQQVPVETLAFSGSRSAAYTGSILSEDKSTHLAGHPSSSQWTKTLTMADSGKLFLIDATNDPCIFNLPGVAGSNGFNCKFVLKVSDTDHDITWTSGADNMITSTNEWNTDTHFSHQEVIQNLILSGSQTTGSVGTSVDVECDGTNYSLTAFATTMSGSGTAAYRVWGSGSTD